MQVYEKMSENTNENSNKPGKRIIEMNEIVKG